MEDLTVMSWLMWEISSLALLEIHDFSNPTFRLLTFVNAFSITATAAQWTHSAKECVWVGGGRGLFYTVPPNLCRCAVTATATATATDSESEYN